MSASNSAADGTRIREQELAFYEVGRYFRLHTKNDGKEDAVLHKKEFIILESNAGGQDGKCICVEKPDDHIVKWSGVGRTHVAIVKSISATKPLKVDEIKLMEFPDDQTNLQNRYARLDHIYHVVFTEHLGEDLGMLSRAGVKELRKRYLVNLTENWELQSTLIATLQEKMT
jgi:hypothetical protein